MLNHVILYLKTHKPFEMPCEPLFTRLAGQRFSLGRKYGFLIRFCEGHADPVFMLFKTVR